MNIHFCIQNTDIMHPMEKIRNTQKIPIDHQTKEPALEQI